MHTTTPLKPPAGRRWRRLAAASLLAVAPLGVAACGGSSSGASTSNKSGNGQGNTASAADMQAYTSCLAKNGVTMPSPPANGEQPSQSGQSGQANGTPPSMPDQATMQAAQKACADLAPAGGMGPDGPGTSGQGTGGADMQAYAECLSQNGVTLPDRSQNGSQGGTLPSMPSSNGTSSNANANGTNGAQPPSGGTPFGLDTSNPKVKAAVDACADKAPKAPTAPSAPSGTPNAGS